VKDTLTRYDGAAIIQLARMGRAAWALATEDLHGGAERVHAKLPHMKKKCMTW